VFKQYLALSVNNAQLAHAHSCLSFTDKAEELFLDNSLREGTVYEGGVYGWDGLTLIGLSRYWKLNLCKEK